MTKEEIISNIYILRLALNYDYTAKYYEDNKQFALKKTDELLKHFNGVKLNDIVNDFLKKHEFNENTIIINEHNEQVNFKTMLKCLAYEIIEK